MTISVTTLTALKHSDQANDRLEKILLEAVEDGESADTASVAKSSESTVTMNPVALPATQLSCHILSHDNRCK